MMPSSENCEMYRLGTVPGYSLGSLHPMYKMAIDGALKAALGSSLRPTFDYQGAGRR